MKSLEEREKREMERAQLVNQAVEAADRIIMDGTDGSVEETDYLTSEVSKRFVEKVHISVSSKLMRRDLE
jgi:hypothetical protein